MSATRMRWLFILPALILLPGLLSAKPKLSATPLFDGKAHENSVLPVRVDLLTDTPIQGNLRIRQNRTGNSVTYPLNVGQGQFRFEIPFQMADTSSTPELLIIEVFGGGKRLGRIERPVELLYSGNEPGFGAMQGTPGGYLAVLVTRNKVELPTLTPHTQTGMLNVRPEQLPESAHLYGMVDSVSVSGESIRDLSPAQTSALLAWVRQGGRLVVDSSASTETYTVAPLISDLKITVAEGAKKPATIEREAITWNPENGGYQMATVTTTQTFRVYHRLIESGNTKAGQDGVHFADLSYGLGRIVLCAIDLSALGISETAGEDLGREDLLTEILLGKHRMRRNTDHDNTGYYFNPYTYETLPTWSRVLRKQTGMKPISGGLIILYLLLFILFVGPIEYVVLEKRRKRVATWVVTPLLAVLFTLSATSISYMTRGTRPYQSGFHFHDYRLDGGGLDTSLRCLVPSKTGSITLDPEPGGVVQVFAEDPSSRDVVTDLSANRYTLAARVWTPRYVGVRTEHDRTPPLVANLSRPEGSGPPTGTVTVPEGTTEPGKVMLMYAGNLWTLSSNAGSWSLLESQKPEDLLTWADDHNNLAQLNQWMHEHSLERQNDDDFDRLLEASLMHVLHPGSRRDKSRFSSAASPASPLHGTRPGDAHCYLGNRPCRPG